MKVLRIGGKFADSHIKRSGKTVLWYFIGCAGVCAVFFFISYKLVALLGLVLVFKQFTGAFDKWGHWYLGKRGELAITNCICDYQRRSRNVPFRPELIRAIVDRLHSLQDHTPKSAQNVAGSRFELTSGDVT
jgi:hypothetical protein